MEVELQQELSRLDDDYSLTAFNSWLLEGDASDFIWKEEDASGKSVTMDDHLALINSGPTAPIACSDGTAASVIAPQHQSSTWQAQPPHHMAYDVQGPIAFFLPATQFDGLGSHANGHTLANPEYTGPKFEDVSIPIDDSSKPSSTQPSTSGNVSRTRENRAGVHQRYRQRKRQAKNEQEKELSTLKETHGYLLQQNSILRERVEVLNGLVHASNAQVNLLTAIQENRQGTIAEALEDGPVKNFAKAAGFDHEKVTVNCLLVYYRQLIAHISEILFELDTIDNVDAVEIRLSHTFQQGAAVFRHLMVMHPEVILKATTLNLQTAVPGTPDPSQWKAALKGAKFKRDQVCRMKLVMQVVWDSMQRLSQERNSLIKDYSSKLSLNPHSSSTENSEELLAIDDIDESLRRLQVTSSKQVTMGGLMMMYLRNVLTETQKATMMVLMYPYFLDPTAMCLAVMSLDADELCAGQA